MIITNKVFSNQMFLKKSFKTTTLIKTTTATTAILNLNNNFFFFNRNFAAPPKPKSVRKTIHLWSPEEMKIYEGLNEPPIKVERDSDYKNLKNQFSISKKVAQMVDEDAQLEPPSPPQPIDDDYFLKPHFKQYIWAEKRNIPFNKIENKKYYFPATLNFRSKKQQLLLQVLKRDILRLKSIGDDWWERPIKLIINPDDESFDALLTERPSINTVTEEIISLSFVQSKPGKDSRKPVIKETKTVRQLQNEATVKLYEEYLTEFDKKVDAENKITYAELKDSLIKKLPKKK
eukprot:TRINITY_DN192_c0_g1_i1.p1 TRINITY_DN192_c0_g1~~TRINITY_DN192_c0_g1_i1.p1  ORF type:complete len:289 (+),score=120.58 TRINITY_DN192_c0_g1_i1:42-908(+)